MQLQPTPFVLLLLSAFTGLAHAASPIDSLLSFPLAHEGNAISRRELVVLEHLNGTRYTIDLEVNSTCIYTDPCTEKIAELKEKCNEVPATSGTTQSQAAIGCFCNDPEFVEAQAA